MKAVIGKNGIVSTVERQRMWMEEINRKHILYFGCHTGLGKTCQAKLLAEEHYRHWLEIAADREPVYETFQAWIKSVSGNNARRLLIIDQVSYLREDSREVGEILEIVNEKIESHGCDLIITGRAECPKWLSCYRFTGLLKCYGKEHFLLGSSEVEKLTEYELGTMAQRLGGKGKEWLKKKSKEIINATGGYGMRVFLNLEVIKENGNSSISYKDRTRQLIWEHFEKNVLPNFDRSTYQCLEKLSVYSSFTRHMAFALLDENEKDAFEHIFDYCSFVSKNAEDVYTILELFRRYMTDRYENRDKEEFLAVVRQAGECCKAERRYEEAMALYEICGDREKLADLFIYMAENADGSYFPKLCERYLSAFSQSDYIERPELLSAKVLIESYHMHVEESNRSLAILKKLAEEERKNNIFGPGRRSYIRTMVVLPHQKSKEYHDVIEKYLELFIYEDECVRNLMVTGGGPSVINGGMDLMGWSSQKKNLYEFVKKVLTVILREDGEGLADVGMGEYYLEKNDRMKALGYLITGTSDIRAKGTFRSLYTANAILARSMLAENKMSSVKDIMNHLIEMVKTSGYPELEGNVRATYIEMMLYEGAGRQVSDWISDIRAGGVGKLLSGDFFISDRYQLYILAKAYIADEKYIDAAVIIRQLLVYAQKYGRKYYLIKLKLLNAIVLDANCEDGTEELVSAVILAARYGYVRIVADEGAGLLPVWSKTDWKEESGKREVPTDFSTYLKTTEKELKTMAGYYPNYLRRCQEGLVLSKCERQVLNLICQGKKNEQIAQEMNVKLSTVKFHVSNIYRKFQVKSRQAAVRKAMDLGWYQ